MDPAEQERARRMILDAYGVTPGDVELIEALGQGCRSTVETAEAEERRERAFVAGQLTVNGRSASTPAWEVDDLRPLWPAPRAARTWPADARAPWLPELLSLLLVMGAIVLVVVVLASR